MPRPAHRLAAAIGHISRRVLLRFTPVKADRRAIAAVEFALIAPVMLLFAAGVVETGALLRAYSTVNRLTMQYALAYADCNDTSTGACQTELSNYTVAPALANVVPQLVAANLTLRMFQVSMSGASPTVVYSYPTGGSLNATETAARAGKNPEWTAGCGRVGELSAYVGVFPGHHDDDLQPGGAGDLVYRGAAEKLTGAPRAAGRAGGALPIAPACGQICHGPDTG